VQPAGQTAEQTHPAPAELAAFAVGQLDDRQAARIEEHLAQCNPCAAIVAASGADTFVRNLQRAGEVRPAEPPRPNRESAPAPRVNWERTLRAVLTPAFLLPLVTAVVTWVLLWIA